MQRLETSECCSKHHSGQWSSLPDFERQLAVVQRQRAVFEDYAACTREWYVQRVRSLRGGMEQYCLYSPLFRQLASARGSVQSQTESPAQRTEPILSESLTQEGGTPMELVVTGTSDESAMIGGGDTAAQPAVVDPVEPDVGDTVTPDPSEPSVPENVPENVAENVESVASDEELSAAAGTSSDISNQVADHMATGELNDGKLIRAFNFRKWFDDC